MKTKAIFLLVFTSILLGCRNKEHDEHAGHQDTLQVLTSSTDKLVSSAQATVKPTFINSANKVRHQGIITLDERRNNIISVRAAGRIEKLYVKYTYKYIRKGEPVLELYSPEISTASEEFLILLNNNDHELIKRSREKLQLLGLKEHQINDLDKQRKVPHSVTIYSEYDGYVFPAATGTTEGSEKTSTQQAMDEMGTASQQENTISPTGQIREGAYLSRGQQLFTVNDMNILWAKITLNNDQQINKGDSVLIVTEKDSIKATAGFVEPYYQKDQQFTIVRVYLENKEQKIKINELITAEIIRQDTSTVLAVPEKSILDLGQRKVVWVKEGTIGRNNLFRARTVTTGTIVNGYIEIVSGVSKDEEIAKAAGYLIDSETLMGR